MDIESIMALAMLQLQDDNLEVLDKKCCSSPEMSDGEGNVTCMNCGLVTNFQMNSYSFDEECTATDSIYSNVLGTKIYGNSRLSRINNWGSFAYQDRVILDVANSLETRLSDKLPKQVIDSALVKYQNHYKKSSIVRGRFKIGTIAACIYFASKELGAEMAPSEITAIFEISMQTFNKCIKLIDSVSTGVTRPSDFTQGIIRKIKFDDRFNRVVDKVCDATDFFEEFESFSPQGVALASTIFVDNEMGGTLTVKEMCLLLRCNTGNITKILRLLKSHKQKIFAASV